VAIILGGVTLSDHLQWVDEFTTSQVRQAKTESLGGSPVFYSGLVTGGRPITLVATGETGWLTRDQVESLKSISEIHGQEYTLTLGSQTFTVLFRHEEGGGFNAEPLSFILDAPSDKYFTANIQLITK
jgi:hypothetical protein